MKGFCRIARGSETNVEEGQMSIPKTGTRAEKSRIKIMQSA